MKRNMRKITVDKLPEMVFDRNKKLRGTLTPIKCKSFANSDVNQNGTSRKHWRLVHLEGDQEFLDSIAQYPDDHVFKLGADGIQIRGGTRPESKKRTNRPIPAQYNQKPVKMGTNTITQMLTNASDEVIRNEENRESREFQHTNVNAKSQRN